MKKLLMIALAAMLIACSSGINVNELMMKMPKSDRTLVLQIPASSNPLSDSMVVGMIKTSGSPSTSSMVQALSIDNANIGVAGNSQMINKATALYALEHVTQVGKNVGVYMMGDSESDKADLEKAASRKNIKLHYFINKK